MTVKIVCTNLKEKSMMIKLFFREIQLKNLY